MTYKLWGWVQLAGAACFVAGAAGMRFSLLPSPWPLVLAALGFILIGVGGWGRGRTTP